MSFANSPISALIILDMVTRKSLAKALGRAVDFPFEHLIELATGGVALEALPGEMSLEQINEEVAERLEVIASRLFDAKVSIEAGEAHCPSETLVVAVPDVFPRLRVTISFRQSEVDEIQCAHLLALPDNEVRRLDVSVHIVLGVKLLDSGDLRHEIERTLLYSLIGDHEDGFERES